MKIKQQRWDVWWHERDENTQLNGNVDRYRTSRQKLEKCRKSVGEESKRQGSFGLWEQYEFNRKQMKL